jgi:hypothetical protein
VEGGPRALLILISVSLLKERGVLGIVPGLLKVLSGVDLMIQYE